MHTYHELRELNRAMMSANQGYWDGKKSRDLTNPIHANWPEGPHFNPDYERGYWSGWNDLGLPHPSDDFAIFDDYDEYYD